MASSRSTRARRCAGDWRASSASGSADSDHRAEMLFEPLIAFARAPLQARAVGDPDYAATGGDHALVLQRADDGVHRRALNAEQARQRFLRQLDAVAGAVLGVKQPARRALG